MNKEELFAIWEGGSVWSRWVKPVLFAHMHDSVSETAPLSLPDIDDTAFTAAANDTALVIDLPGAQGVAAGVTLTWRGYRPVPLYNAIPLPTGEPGFYDRKPVAAVDVVPIMEALRTGAEKIAAANLAPDAPPAFLLDADRMAAGRKMLGDEFDNRSVCFTTDFPSANFLASRGIRRAVLVQKRDDDPQEDLAHVLRRWEDGGIVIERISLDCAAGPRSFKVTRPRWYTAMFQRVIVAFTLHRASGGGFGNWIEHSSSGG